ncbi:MAG TPA: CvpA family protein [Chloroflexia bacterium]|nr:CvpA family protein [Chloroflexia bacterium]
MTGFNWVDLALLVMVALIAIGATSRGFLQVAVGLAGFVLTLTAALLFTAPVAAWLDTHTGVPQLWTPPLAFLGLWLGAQLLYTGIAHVLLRRTFYQASRSRANRWLALLPGALQGVLIGSLLLTLLALAPIPGMPQQAILNSAIGGRLVSATVAVERPLEGVFGPALRQSLGFLTVKPEGESGETVLLKFQVPAPAADPDAEEQMLNLVNAERSGRGLAPLVMDPALRQLARAHATDMFQQGYFSHTGRDGRSPFDRMHDARISYSAAGENLALAPTTEFAHEGLMHSPGHRANILNSQFHKIGIGVMDGGIYGKMFVQEFTD